MESRKKDLKKAVSKEDGRRRRGECVVQLRKAQKEEGLAKRRNILVNNFTAEEAQSAALAQTDSTSGNPSASTTKPSTPKLGDIPEMMALLHSPDLANQLTGLRGFRRLLSTERNPPVQQCIDCGAIPLFVAFLQRADSVELQFEAAWALTNIASTDRTRVVVECGAVPFLVQLLSSPSHEVREQCAWCLGNVAGDGAELRDFALRCGALMPLLANVAQPANISLLRNCTWSLSNFCRGKPQPDLSILKPAVPLLASILNTASDQDTIIDATWALSYISDGDNNRIQEVVSHGVILPLVNMLRSNKANVIVPALRTLGNIVSGNDSQTQAVVDGNVLPTLVNLLSHSKKNIRKEVCWMLSNIAAGSSGQLTQLINTPEILPHVLTQLSSAAEWDVRKEATWVVSNIATGGTRPQIAFLVEQGAIKPLCDLFDVGDVRILLVALEALEAILKASSDASKIVQMVDEAEGIDKLENLQEHENQDVYEKAVKIIETYFGGEEDEESENLTPAEQNASTFSFGLQSNVGKNAQFAVNGQGRGQHTHFDF